jgi:uncharacterized protein (TIGR02996 family)
MHSDPTFAALLRAVLEAPDDDAPRLILADWHDERAAAGGSDWNRARAAAIREAVGSPSRIWRSPTMNDFDGSPS